LIIKPDKLEVNYIAKYYEIILAYFFSKLFATNPAIFRTA
jgi:hypothetical protein